MKNKLLLSIAFISTSYFGYSQCSPVPIREAVRNGNFELGYLAGPAAKNHVSVPNSNYDFYCDMDFLGNYPAAPASHDVADHYAVMRAENFNFESTNYVNNTYWGVGYGGDAGFKDHTTGIVHDGYALVVDLAFRTTSPKTGGKPIAWEQTMDIFPNEKYWFSAWIANYSTAPSVPIMQVVVVPYKASDGLVDAAGIDTLPIIGSPAGVMQWTNMSSSWTPTGVYNKVTIRFEFVNTSGGSTGLDVAIDDISFINTCQNVNGLNAYTADFKLTDTVNLCNNNGTITLDPNVIVGQQNNATIHWYSGAGNPQTEIATGNWSQTITTAGSYRVCIDDPDNSCAVVDNVVLIDNFTLPLADLALCVPSFYTLDAGFNIPNGAFSSITWNGPSGTSNIRTYDVTQAGAHTVSIVSAPGLNCNYSGAFNVTSTVPAFPTNLSFRECADTTLNLTVGDGKNYTWSENQNLTPAIGTGITVPYFIPSGTLGDKTIWVQSADYTALPAGGPTGGSLSGYPAAASPLAFTTTKATTLNSFVVQTPLWANGCAAAGSTVSITFTLTGPVNLTHTEAMFPCGDILTTVTPNWTLPAGSYTLSSSISLRFCPALGSRTIGGGIITITNADATNNNVWNMFADMSFSAITACDPAPIKLTAICCNKPADNPTVDVTSVLTTCKAADAQIVFSPLTNGLDYKFIVSHNNGLTYSDTTSGVVAGGKVTLAPVSGSGIYKVVFASTGNLNKACAKTSSDSAIVVIKSTPSKPVVTLNPNKTTFCLGEAHTLTATSTVAGGGAITYTWSIDATGNGATKNGLTTLGAHSYKVLATAAGCSDSTTTNTNVIPLDSAKILAAGPFCNGAGPYQLLLTGGSTAGGTWSGTGVNTTTGIFTPTGLAGGTYKIKYTSSATVCAEVDSIDIVVNPSFSYTITSPKNSYCKNGSIDTIEVNTAGGTFWTKSGKGITDANNGYYDPKSADVGLDTIWYGTAGACGDTAQLAITIYDSTTVTFVLPDDEVCLNTPAFLLEVVSLPNGVFSGSGVSGTTFTPATAGAGAHTITYTYTDGNACISKIQDVLTVDPLPPVTLVLDTTSGCIDKTAITLSGGTPLGGVYSGTAVAGGKINPSATTAGAYTITYTYTDPGTTCVNSASASFAVNALPDLALSDTTVCSGIILDASTNATIAQPATYAWDGAAATNIATKAVISSGPHTVVVTDNNKCQASATITVTVNTPPSVSLGPDTTVCFTGKETWNDTIANTYTTIAWSTGDVSNTTVLSKADTVKVIVSNASGCFASDTIYVGEHCDAIKLCFPDVFTPNSDSYNDDFRPCGNNKEIIKDNGNYNFYSENIIYMHFLIYDRWGIKMYENNNPEVPVWDGYFKNKLAASGTYYWVVKYTDSSKTTYEQSGYVTLLKD